MVEISRTPSIVLYINWGTGTDADTTAYNDVSAKYLRNISVQSGRDQDRATSPAKVATLSTALDNDDRTFSNAAGPLAGYITRGKSIEYNLKFGRETDVNDPLIDVNESNLPVNGIQEEVIFRGALDSTPQNLDVLKSVSISALGTLRFLSKIKVTTPLYENILTGAALHELFNYCGVPTNYRNFSAGQVSLRYWFLKDANALQAFYQLVASEGAGAAGYEGYGGMVHFEDNAYRASNVRSTTVQWYLRDSFTIEAGWLLHSPTTQYLNNPDEILNEVVASTNNREEQTATTVWNYGANIVVPPSDIRRVYAVTNEPFKSAIVPVNGTDYSLLSGSIASIVLERTSGLKTGITITAGAGGATIQGPALEESKGLKLRANLVPVVSTVDLKQTAVATASINQFELNSYSVPLYPEINPNTVQDIVDGVYTRYKEVREQAVIRVRNIDSYHMDFIVNAKVSDRVRLVVTHEGVDEDFFIESKSIEQEGTEFTAVVGLEKVYEVLPFRFGINVFGDAL